ncbi:hypothetical protein D1007_46218 [Hordeum vulgare]|nr:hypothetical protein D1007_46218 [Hordeum vulgare]
MTEEAIAGDLRLLSPRCPLSLGSSVPPDGVPPDGVPPDGRLVGLLQLDSTDDAKPAARKDVFGRPTAEAKGGGIRVRLQRVGSIHLHLASRWVTVRDEDNDILADRFLQDGEDPKVGDCMDIDGFLLIVGDLREEVPIHRDIAKVCFDLTTDPPRFGGRFWVLADREDVDDEAESQTVEAIGSRQDGVSAHVEEEHSEASAPSSPCTPSPSMEELQECKTRRDHILVRKKMELPARKPWIGPIPKDLPGSILQADLDSVSLGYLAQDAPDQGVSCVLTTSSGIVEELSHASCFQPPRTRVRSSKPGFPPLGSGRATRIPSPVAPAGSTMAGRGSKPPPLQRHSGQQTGQGNPLEAKPSPTVAAQPGKAVPATASTQQGKVPANNGRMPSGATVQARESSYANKQHSSWGDDGFCGYGEGYHRGGASARGGRGQAWQNNGNAGNGFNAPPGQFVTGPLGLPHPKRGGFRQNWIGRGGGRKPRAPLAAPEQSADPISSLGTVLETVKEVADCSVADQSLVGA